MESTLTCPLRKAVRGPELSQQKEGTTPENAPPHVTAHGGTVWWKNNSWKKSQTCRSPLSSTCTHTHSGFWLEQPCKLPAISFLNKRINVLEERAFRTVHSSASLLRILVLRMSMESSCSSFRKGSVSLPSRFSSSWQARSHSLL